MSFSILAVEGESENDWVIKQNPLFVPLDLQVSLHRLVK